MPSQFLFGQSPTPSSHVSTGQLPAAEDVGHLVDDVYARFKGMSEGAVSQVYPALARMAPDLFGISVVGTNGAIFEAGDALVPFSIMSVSKPFVLALVIQDIGWEALRGKVGANATGMAFNSAAAVERSADGCTNPMVNAGAIATSSLTRGAGPEDRWQVLWQGLSRFAGRTLELNAEVYQSASETNFRNRALVNLLESLGRVYCDPMEALDLYTRQCALNVTARDLAVMGATLADGGVNPVTGERVVDQLSCRYALAVMATSGMYETSGDWLCDIGLPGKSGIGGGIVTVSPGKGGLGTFAPLLDAAGNSVRGILVAEALSHALGLDLFLSDAAT